MKASVSQSVGTRPVPSPPEASGPLAEVVSWINREAMPILRRLRDVLNASYREVASVRTTDATPTVIWSATMSPHTAWTVYFAVIAMSTADDYAGYDRLLRVKWDGTSYSASTDTLGTDVEDVAGWDVSMLFVPAADSTLSVTLLVTGSAGKTVDWAVSAKLNEAPAPTL